MGSGAVWGIDIGQCALKALKCRAHEDPKKVVAEAFDYIEYPKILSQPGSDPVEIVGDALKQFLSRNSVLGDRVAVSVSGQAGLARFIKLPPVDAKKIPDLVRYEARQQIPFDLNDVVWDYQRMGCGSVEEGFALETEVGLFAIKRDAVLRALDPFIKLDIEVDIVQLTPLVLYNFVLFDQIGKLPPPEDYDPEDPPESTVIISMGTDATDLVITNGYRVWQRSIPLGGSHFTKALTRELKLTFAKAEHLKRNATAAADPKAVFQAMKPTFNDMLTELQRSISYFSNLDRAAKIGRVVALGNAMKLPGLRRYLSQSLGFEIEKIEAYHELVGQQVIAAPAFQENLLSFGVCYGLALQGLNKSGVYTNLLPREIIQDRMIRRKKPWAVAIAAVLLLAFFVHYTFHSLAVATVAANTWKDSHSQASRLVDQANRLKTEDTQVRGEFQSIDQIGQHLVGNAGGRTRWMELLKTINECLPTRQKADDSDIADLVARISKRTELHVTNIDCQQVEDVAPWYATVKRFEDTASDAAGTPPAQSGQPNTPPGQQPPQTGLQNTPPGQAPVQPSPAAAQPEQTNPADEPKGPGWIVRIGGYHYHNQRKHDPNFGPEEAQFVRNTLVDALRNGSIKLPSGESDKEESLTMQELGISHPVLVSSLCFPARDVEVVIPGAEIKVTDSAAVPGEGLAARPKSRMIGGEMPIARGRAPGMPIREPGMPAGGAASDSTSITLKQYDFVVQFCWQPKSATERQDAKKAAEAKKTTDKNAATKP